MSLKPGRQTQRKFRFSPVNCLLTMGERKKISRDHTVVRKYAALGRTCYQLHHSYSEPIHPPTTHTHTQSRIVKQLFHFCLSFAFFSWLLTYKYFVCRLKAAASALAQILVFKMCTSMSHIVKNIWQAYFILFYLSILKIKQKLMRGVGIFVLLGLLLQQQVLCNSQWT